MTVLSYYLGFASSFFWPSVMRMVADCRGGRGGGRAYRFYLEDPNIIKGENNIVIM